MEDQDLDEDLEMVGKLGVGGVTWEEGEHLDYATIAKAGGRKDLLHHFDTAQSNMNKSSPPPSATVDWFAHQAPSPPKEVTPYVSPLKDHWCQWNNSPTKLPEIVKGGRKGQTYPPGMNSKDQVNFARLMALDYQKEWLQKRHNKQEKQKKKARDMKLTKMKKLQDHMRGKNMVQPSDSKDRFTMKRFKNIPSKVKLPPI